jgi:L-malate glycosyltransferase
MTTLAAIHQFAPVLAEHDAIGNEAAALNAMFRRWGSASDLIAARRDTLYGMPTIPWREYRFAPSDVLVVHYSHWTNLFPDVFALPNQKILLYHRVTPPDQLRGVDVALVDASRRAVLELPRYRNDVMSSLAHAALGAAELTAAGFQSPAVVPYLLRNELYSGPAEPAVLGKITSRKGNKLAVVGRLMPHKRIEESIFVLDYLRRYADPDWSLIVVGDRRGAEAYAERLEILARRLGLEDCVRFLGRISQPELLAVYRSVDALLFLSEHEGFGVPVVEAMALGIPVFAYAAGAVPEVLGDAGVLLPTRDTALIAETIALVTQDALRRKTLIERQTRRAQGLSPAVVENQWRQFFSATIMSSLR